MIIHPSLSRGLARHGWLTSRHTFSFADYFNPDRMSFGVLRVLNDDTIAPGMGFGTHPHKDMEIITIPLEGALQHKDSEGNASVIRKDEVQLMSAGSGIAHSEFNASPYEEVKLLQIWILPKVKGIKPRYAQQFFSREKRHNRVLTIVSPDGRDNSIIINQNAIFSLSGLDAGQAISYSKQFSDNGLYIFIIDGDIHLEGQDYRSRDGIGLEEFESVQILAKSNAEVLLMEVPI